MDGIIKIMEFLVSSSLKDNDFLFGGNSVFIEEVYQRYLKNPSSVDSSWQEFFKNYSGENGKMKPDWEGFAKVVGVVPEAVPTKGKAPQFSGGKFLADKIIGAYRDRGHLISYLDPLMMEKLETEEEAGLDLKSLGVTDSNLSEIVDTKFGKMTISDLVQTLKNIYSSSVGVEVSHLVNKNEINWLHDFIEQEYAEGFTKEQKISMLENLIAATGMEQYLHVKYPGAKRFSVEGGEGYIAALEYSVEHFAKNGVKEAVIGMAHRGRLNTLARAMGKPYRALFSEFNGKSAFPPELGIAGDVKYHMGYKNKRKIEGNEIDLELLPNPSHLEAVNPVVAGRIRASQDSMGDKNREKAVGVLVHGDAAFCGQGIVAESLAMSGLSPYDTGGIMHFVINNQVGFTANPKDGRVSRYSTDIAKMADAPIFHANGDDVEAIIMATRCALEFRRIFKKDAVVEIICYRKYGHNEGDEPFYTQPEMYSIIKQKQTPPDIYGAKLVSTGVITAEEFDKMKADFKSHLDTEFKEAEKYEAPEHKFDGLWKGYKRDGKEVASGYDKKKLVKIGTELSTIPSDFNINSKLKKLFDARLASLKNDTELDWATGEQLAFASLLDEGVNIRITGQDAGRGTFSHRHSVLHDQENGKKYQPLNNFGAKGTYEVADSNLSEYGVLGFEFGYSVHDPKNLVIWEAQFGDFANGAQIMFDQFIVSSEQKWMQMSGLVCLLPHGYEGQGPEHSSARLERFLQSCAENNIQVANPTNPASIYHLLRRQIVRDFRKPLIVMTPKSLLRHKLATSKLSDFDKNTRFMPVLDDGKVDASKVKKIVLCTGKVYYDLLDKRDSDNKKDVAIIRLEQLYPFPKKELEKIFARYKGASRIVWAQEEPENMGAWNFVNYRIRELIGSKELEYVGRCEAASPACGYMSVHQEQQKGLVEKAIGK